MWPFDKKQDQIEKRALQLIEEQRAVTSIPGYWPDAGFDGQQVASVSRALSLVPVFGAARLLADTIASLPLNLYKNDSRGIPKRQPTPSLFANPSIHGTLYDWIFRAVVSMALQGDAIGLVTQRDFYGFPTMIEWLNPEQVATQDGKLYGPGSYMNPMWWWWGRPINPRELVHIPWFTLPYRVRGLSPIGAYQLTTNIGIGAKEYQANWFGQGGVPPGTFKNAERTIDQGDADKLTARLTARLQARQPLVFGRDWDYTPIAIKPHEAQFIECVAGSTQFAMADGTLRRADHLGVGDEIQAWDGRKLVADRVSAAVQMPVAPTVRVITACGREIVTTPNHPYLGLSTDSETWIYAGDLKIGDYVRRSDSRWTRVVAVDDAGEQITYGISVEKTHTHVTNGIITHNTCQMTATDIAVIYGVPPEKIGGTTGKTLTYSTTELNGIDYLTFSIRPWLVRFEYALTRCFQPGVFPKFGVEEMLRTDAKTKAQIDSLALGFQNRGWLSQDEVRASYDRGPLPKQDLPQVVQGPGQSVVVQGIDGKPAIINGNGNGKSPAPQQDTPSGSSGANHALAGTRSGRQALMELYAMRGYDEFGRKIPMQYMRSRVVQR